MNALYLKSPRRSCGRLAGKTAPLPKALNAVTMTINFSLGSSFSQYGIDIAISEDFLDPIKKIDRFGDRRKKLTIISADHAIYFLNATDRSIRCPKIPLGNFLAQRLTAYLPTTGHAGDFAGHLGEKAKGKRRVERPMRVA